MTTEVVFEVGEAELDVVVDVADGASVADVVEALAGGPVTSGTALVADGVVLAPELSFAAAGVRRGAVIRLATAFTEPSDRCAVERDAPIAPTTKVIRAIGGVHAGGSWPLRAGRSVIGRGAHAEVRIDAPTVSRCHAILTLGPNGDVTIDDTGSANGTRVAGSLAAGPRAVSDGDIVQLGAVQILVAQGDDRTAALPTLSHGRTPFNRPPRLEVPAQPFVIVAPGAVPSPPPGLRLSWAAIFVPLVLGLGLAALFGPMMAAFALFGPVMLLANWFEDRRRAARQRAVGEAELADGLTAFRRAIADGRNSEVDRRRRAHPSPAALTARALGPSTRLWERRGSDPDFMRLSIGLGTAKWAPVVSDTSAGRALEVDHILDSVVALDQVPVIVDASPRHTIGVAGDREAALAAVRGLLVQVSVLHGPSDVRIAVVTSAARAEVWDWVKWMPHAEGLLVADGEEEARMIDRLTVGPRDSGPMTFVVVDRDGCADGIGASVRQLLSGRGAPVAAVVLADRVEELPSVCTACVQVDEDGLATVMSAETALPDVLIGGVTTAAARACARAMAGLLDPDVEGSAAPLPDAVALVAIAASPALTTARWRAMTGCRGSLRTTLGVAAEGPLTVDLVADGPHALVAGTTGSGKSELLRTWVAGLAGAYGPNELTFVLIDYKGGSAFADAGRLPHTVGLVTDLDEHLGARALRCLEAELRHRERVLAAAGASGITSYGGAHPLPRLVVVIDEFATMATELPDFVDALVGVAQRGRSLGVHLILATQRPSGSVSDNIRANTNIRIALRVQDGPDSIDVIGRPDAAAVEVRRPGRGFARLGPGGVTEFQAALVSATTACEPRHRVRVRPFAFGSAVLDAVATDGPNDLARIVDGAEAAATALGLAPPRRPWPAPLPSDVSQGDVPAGACGVIDDPDRQLQAPFSWAADRGSLLLVGAAGSGTTTALASVATALAAVTPPDALHLYVLDFDSGGLGVIGALPHAGAFVGAAERERQERLIRMLRAELEERRAAANSTSASRPRLVLLIDNFGGFNAAFDDAGGIAFRDDVFRLLADGGALGIAVVASADRPGAVPAAVSSVVADKLVFRLADPYDYLAFGMPARDAASSGPGRAVDPATKLEIQMARPDFTVVGSGARVAPGVGRLPDEVAVDEVARAAARAGGEWFVPVGIGDQRLAPVGLHLGEGDHALVAGPARSGKSTVLCTIAHVVRCVQPDAAVTAVVLRRSPLRNARLDRVVTRPADLEAVLATVAADPAPQIVLVDDADMVDDAGGGIARLLGLRRPDVHVIAAGRADALRSAYGHWVNEVRRCRQGVLLRPHPDLDGELWHVTLPRHGPVMAAAGRGYLVAEGRIELMQAARP